MDGCERTLEGLAAVVEPTSEKHRSRGETGEEAVLAPQRHYRATFSPAVCDHRVLHSIRRCTASTQREGGEGGEGGW